MSSCNPTKQLTPFEYDIIDIVIALIIYLNENFTYKTIDIPEPSTFNGNLK